MAGIMSINGLISGLNTDQIITSYMAIARQPEQQLTDQKTKAQNQLAAWQDLNTRVLALQTQSSAIASSTNFQTKTATSSQQDIVDVSASTDATAGTYNVTVNKTAKSHQIASQTYSGLDSAVSSGTIKSPSTAPRQYQYRFHQQYPRWRERRHKQGQRRSQRVRREPGYREQPTLLMVLTSSQTGTDHKMVIDAGTTGLQINTDKDGNGNRTLVQAAGDAEIMLGSLKFTRGSNSISDIIPGVTLNLSNADTTKTVKIDVTQDTQSSKTAIQNFVSQYNDIITTIKNDTSYDSQTGNTGVLMGNYEVQALEMDLESAVTNSVPGIPIQKGQQTYNALSTIGITTGTDGLLVIDDAQLSSALSDHAADVGKLFGTTMQSDSPYVSLVSSNSDTKESGIKGYGISVTQAATRATLTASKAMNGTLTADEILTLNGKQVSLQAGWSLTDVINEINKHTADTNVSAIDTLLGTDHFLTLRALQYGSNSNITAVSSLSVNSDVTSGVGNMTVSLTSNSVSGEGGAGTRVLGLDVAGTINGERAKGNGQVLTADPESPTSPVKGLQVLVTNPTAGDANATFIKGVGTRIQELLTKMTGSNGVFTTTETSLNSQIDATTKDISDMEDRLKVQQDQLYTQFNDMETKLAALQQQSDYLTQQFSSLTSSK